MSQPAVEIRDVFRVYPAPEGGVVALQGLTLEVQEGEVCVVLGPSGSGKSSLLRMLAALDTPTAGSVRVLGRDLSRLGRRGRAAYRAEVLGYADQHYWRALAPELGVRELVGMQLGLAGVPRHDRFGRAGELLQRVGLLDRADAHPTELSGGEQQRVAVCAALAHRPRLLLADEPTGELDAANARLVYEAIAELARGRARRRCSSATTPSPPRSPTESSACATDESARRRRSPTEATRRSWSAAADGCDFGGAAPAHRHPAPMQQLACTRTESSFRRPQGRPHPCMLRRRPLSRRRTGPERPSQRCAGSPARTGRAPRPPQRWSSWTPSSAAAA